MSEPSAIQTPLQEVHDAPLIWKIGQGHPDLRSIRHPLRLWRQLHEQRDAPFLPSIEREIDRVEPFLLKLQLLNVHDEIPGNKNALLGQHDFDRHINVGHDRFAIFIHEQELNRVLSFFPFVERHPKGDGTLRVNGRELLRINRVEGAQNIELATVVRGGVAENGNLNVHIIDPSTSLKDRDRDSASFFATPIAVRTQAAPKAFSGSHGRPRLVNEEKLIIDPAGRFETQLCRRCQAMDTAAIRQGWRISSPQHQRAYR
jgi:hypothetical protein